MTLKTLLATAALAATAALVAAPAAKADPAIGFSIGFGGFGPGFYGHHRPHMPWGYGTGYGYGYAPSYGYAAPVSYGISCGTGANILRGAGYNGVHALSCSGSVYTYEAWRRGQPFQVSVNTAGAIVGVAREF